MKIHSLLISCLVCAATATQAQVAVQNNGTLFITGGSDIFYINGSLTNANTGALTNNGNLYVLQNLTNAQASMPAGTGTLYLNGTAAQTVAGAQPFKTYNLVTNNAAGITLNANLSVSGAHTFTNGVITTSVTPNYLVYEAGSSYSGDADTRHVNGWVKKFGSTNFIFPVGNGTIERPAELQSLSASSEFDVTYNTPAANAGNVLFPIVIIHSPEFWTINRISGGTAQVNLNWDNAKVPILPFAIPSIKVTNYTAGNWTDQGGTAAGNISTTGNVLSPAINNFGSFAIGSYTFAIPVNFISFTGYRNNGISYLSWATATEQNLDRFNVERSEDGSSFRSIGMVTPHNNSLRNDYSFEDRAPINAKAYYRINSVDRDGKNKFTRSILITEGKGKESMYVLNNPVQQSISLYAGASFTGKYEYNVLNTAGQTIQSGQIQVTGAGTFSIPLKNNIAAGTYILNVKNTEHQFTQSILVR